MEEILLQNQDFNKFDDIANKLLNEVVLIINGLTFRLTEIEFYLHDDIHKDIYTHRHKDQATSLKWYFHKMGHSESYKGGTYKCVDITFGYKDQTKKNVFGGILIRSIKQLDTNEEIIGPCNVVNHILKLNNCTAIEELVKLTDNGSCIKKSVLYLKKNNTLAVLPIQSGPRIGLNYKYPDFAVKNYRYLTNVKTNDKYRASIIINLHKEGKTNEEISKLTDVKVTQIKKYIDAYSEYVKTNTPETKISVKELKPSNTTIIQLQSQY